MKRYEKWIKRVGQAFFLLVIPFGVWNAIVTHEYTQIISSVFVGIVGALLWGWSVKKSMNKM